jgi:hypothetical protein
VANNGLINVDGGSSDPGSGVGTDGSGASPPLPPLPPDFVSPPAEPKLVAVNTDPT